MSTKILFTGADGSLRSAAFDEVQRELSAFGWQVQRESDPAQTPDADKTLIVCDRGADEPAPSTVAERDRYDGVFVFVSGEDAEASARPAVCAWVGHPHLRVVDRSGRRGDSLLAKVRALLGIPRPCEIERKFLIRMPDIGYLHDLPECRAAEISQTYLLLPDGTRARIRRRGEGADCVYFQTVKTRLTDLTRIEVEKHLTREEYESLLPLADPRRRTIEKTRYCLVWDNAYYEIDCFPFWKKQAFVEIELHSEDQPFSLPPFLEVIREVTSEKDYANSALARRIPEEER